MFDILSSLGFGTIPRDVVIAPISTVWSHSWIQAQNFYMQNTHWPIELHLYLMSEIKNCLGVLENWLENDWLEAWSKEKDKDGWLCGVSENLEDSVNDEEPERGTDVLSIWEFGCEKWTTKLVP